MFTASSDGEIFVMDGRPSKHFAVLGFICKALCSETAVAAVVAVAIKVTRIPI